MTFGAELRAQRKALHLTQDEACEILELTKSTLYRYEQGKTEPSEEKQQRILSKLNSYKREHSKEILGKNNRGFQVIENPFSNLAMSNPFIVELEKRRAKIVKEHERNEEEIKDKLLALLYSLGYFLEQDEDGDYLVTEDFPKVHGVVINTEDVLEHYFIYKEDFLTTVDLIVDFIDFSIARSNLYKPEDIYDDSDES